MLWIVLVQITYVLQLFCCFGTFAIWIDTSEVQAILFALKRAYQPRESKFMTFSNSLSTLQALEKLKTDHPQLIQIQDMLH